MVKVSSFDDIYTLTYEALNIAKENHAPLKAYKGSHFSPLPHKLSLDFLTFFSSTYRGLFSFATYATQSKNPKVSDLEVFDNKYKPYVSMKQSFETYYASYGLTTETKEDCFKRIVDRSHYLGYYRGGSSGYEEESQAVASSFFAKHQIPAKPNEVMIFTGGFKGAMLSLCAALMLTKHQDQVSNNRGSVLVPKGYYQSIRLIPTLFQASVECTDSYSAEFIHRWANSSSKGSKIIYVPSINNENGRGLSKEKAIELASVILNYNSKHRDNPIFVVADDVYMGSHLKKDAAPVSISSIAGKDIGNPDLGRMFDWSVSIVTSSKTFALPTSRISFAASGNAELRYKILHYRSILSQGRVPQINELFSLAAMSFTPLSWIESWNKRTRSNLNMLKRGINLINLKYETEVYAFEMPDGGWYLPLRISRKFMGDRIASSVELSYLLACYSDAYNSGIAALPGEMFGYTNQNTNDWYALRLNIADNESFVMEIINRLDDFARSMSSKDTESSTSSKIKQLHKRIPKLKKTIEEQRF